MITLRLLMTPYICCYWKEERLIAWGMIVSTMVVESLRNTNYELHSNTTYSLC